MICCAPGCTAEVVVLSRGLCKRHYNRWYKFGDLDIKVRRDLPALERLLLKCERTPDGCLMFRGPLTPKGYAHVWVDGKMRFLHVVTWEEKNGPVPEGLELDHTCKHRACCEEGHLEPVTHQVNVSRGRAGSDWVIRPRDHAGRFYGG